MSWKDRVQHYRAQQEAESSAQAERISNEQQLALQVLKNLGAEDKLLGIRDEIWEVGSVNQYTNPSPTSFWWYYKTILEFTEEELRDRRILSKSAPRFKTQPKTSYGEAIASLGLDYPMFYPERLAKGDFDPSWSAHIGAHKVTSLCIYCAHIADHEYAMTVAQGEIRHPGGKAITGLPTIFIPGTQDSEGSLIHLLTEHIATMRSFLPDIRASADEIRKGIAENPHLLTDRLSHWLEQVEAGVRDLSW